IVIETITINVNPTGNATRNPSNQPFKKAVWLVKPIVFEAVLKANIDSIIQAINTPVMRLRLYALVLGSL
ncbi:hypothetical protein SB772_45745, partial [Paraburkholderia sp. SIMBA_030]